MPDPKPYDGQHGLTGYGNYAGWGNRQSRDNPDYVAAERQKDPHYDETSDPRFVNDPNYAPIDGMDAAAMRHDHNYNRDHPSGNTKSYEPFTTWKGMQDVREDDRQLVKDVDTEMGANGDKYSAGATRYSEGLRGFFGGRVDALDAVDWGDKKAGEVGAGVSGALHDAESWHSLGDVGRGLGSDVTKAGNWLGETAGEAWEGVSGAASHAANLGWPGLLGEAAGVADVATVGAGHAAGGLWDSVKSAGSTVAGWLGF